MTDTETTHRDPWQEMATASQRFQRALFIADEQPHAHAADDVDHRRDEMGLAALALVRHLSANPDDRPPGWDSHPVDGTPDDPSYAAHRAYACGICREEFGTNCRPGEIQCPECEARLCPQCGHWESTDRF